jgi:hypothetical protein
VAAAVTEDVWCESNTTPDAIANALRRLLHERHAANQALAPARVLNLIVVVDRDWKGEIANRLAQVGRYHASRNHPVRRRAGPDNARRVGGDLLTRSLGTGSA